MEASQLDGEAEECSSSESGWTMYLASPMHDNGVSDDHDDVEEDDHGDAAADSGCNNNSSGGGEEGDEDDDSMASDASTGPARNKYSYRKGDGIKVREQRLKHDEENDGNYSQHSSHSIKIAPKLENDRDGNGGSPSHREAGSSSSKSNPPEERKINLSNK